MTLYWWTHWFWITTATTAIILIVLLMQPPPTLGRPSNVFELSAGLQQPAPFQPSLNTHPFQTARDDELQARQARRREPLQFPRRAEPAESLMSSDGIDVLDIDEDVEDIFNGHSIIQAASYRESLSARSQELLTPTAPAAISSSSTTASTTTTTTTTEQTTPGRHTTVAVPVEEIIATRLSTKKRPAVLSAAAVAFADADLTNVTRVNVTLIRSTARSNKTSNFITSSSYRNSNSSSTNITAINSTSPSTSSGSDPSDSSRSANSSSSTSINTSRSDETLTDDDVDDGTDAAVVPADISASASEDDDGAAATADDEDRHNYTNEQQAAVLAVPGGSSFGKVTNEKGAAVRQSKVLVGEHEEEAQQRSAPALEANLLNLTGGGGSSAKSLLADFGVPVAMNARASRAEENADGDAAAALPVKRSAILDAGAISGICIATVALCGAVSTAGVVLYRRRFVNKPQTLSEPDSSGYIDDSINRDNSDEMYSLDNDSFLNSLEAMTIQNYWTENVKHTKL